jgi:hypothetical protein
MARVLNNFTAWPDNAMELSTDRVIEMYKEGFAGAFQDPEESDKLNQSIVDAGGEVDGEAVATRFGFAGEGDGALVILFPSVYKAYGKRALTRPGQKTGDCVSMAGRDVGLYTICLEWDAGLPDEVSGKPEAPPQVSEVALQNGVFANEGIYKSRGHNGQGMACSEGVRWVTTEGGIILRADYSQQGGVDLEQYNVQFEVSGRSGTPEWLDKVGRVHPIRDVTRPRGHEAARDFIARGKPIWVCSGYGFSDVRNEDGYSRRQGSWSHSWHIIGYDDRRSTITKYGFPLALFGHRWAVWNSGPRTIRDSVELVPSVEKQQWTDLGLVDPSNGLILIPEGYAWIDARLLDNCDLYAVGGAAGWETSALPEYLGGF